MLLVFSLLGISGAFLFFCGRGKDLNVVETAVFAISGYLLSMIVSAAALLVFDFYSIKKSALFLMLFWGALAVFSWVKGNRPSLNYDIKLFVIPLLLSFAGIIFVSLSPFEYFAMGQDEGVYQTEAIMYIRHQNHKQFEANEYYVANTDVFREDIVNCTTPGNILGTFFYNENNLEMMVTGQNNHSLSSISLVFHGLHTISAMLGWWGAIFGISNMAGINCLMYVLSIFWVSIICRRLKVGKVGMAVACAVFMISPIVIWVSKSALTEAGLTLIWLVLIYLMLSDRKRDLYLAACLIGISGLYHVSLYVFMPLFVFVFIALYLYTANNDYIKTMMLSVAAYLISFIVALANACGYTLMNYKKAYILGIDQNNIFAVVITCCVLTEIVGAVLLKVKIKKFKFNMTVIKWLVRILLAVSIVFGVYRLMKDAPAVNEASYLTIVSMAVMTGIVLPVIAFISLLVRTDRWTDSKSHLIMLVLFLYCVILYSTFMVPTISEYYYWARYFAMYIPIICIVGGIVIDRMKPVIGIVAAIFSVAILMPHSIFLMNHIDDTRVQWDSLEEIEETIQFSEPDAIVMRPELYNMFYYEFKSLDIPVFPITENFDEEISYLQTQYETIYIMDFTFDGRFESSCPVVRRFLNLDTQDLGQHKTRFFLLPEDTTYNMQTVTLYQWQ